MSDLVSLCVLRLEVHNQESDTTKMSEEKSNNSDQRQPGDIRIETFPNKLESTEEDWNFLPPEKGTRLTEKSEVKPVESEEEIAFFSGNPFVEVTKGILHLYKDDSLKDRSTSTCLCLLGIPSAMSCHDFLSFTAPCHADISHIRILRDPIPNQYIALLNFRSHTAAAEFRSTFDGSPYSGLEPDYVCRAVWVSRVEWVEAATGGDQPPSGHTELPICPVCLERMDESIDGVLTILCNHAFHAECLIKWGDSTCPVCRCVQSPEMSEEGTECASCPPDQAPPAADSLWICLVCGHVGCGRYQGGHAAKHYHDTGHCYALQLGSRRVWDYKGDNFVHRLLQNKADGKLVAVSESSTAAQAHSAAQEKIDAIQLEYTYLLTSQLDSQRRYFEEKLSRAEAIADVEIDKLRDQLIELEEYAGLLKGDINDLTKEKQAAEKKTTQLSSKLSLLQKELSDERVIGKALRSNQQQWQARFSALEKKCAEEKAKSDAEIASLREQLRDIMFYLDAQQKIANSEHKEDIQGGTVTVGQTPVPGTSSGTERKTGKGRKKKR